MRIRACLVVLVAVSTLAGPAARADTTCDFGGPTPGFHIARMDLPNGSDFATIHLTTARPTMPAGDRSSWHLSMGFAIVDAATHEIVTSRIYNAGSSTRRAVVVTDGMDLVRQDVPGPDVTFVHQAWVPVNRLAPGSYYLVGFGSDGDTRLPNPWWGAEFHVSGAVSCSAVGEGEVFDIDHSSFTGGTQASALAAGVAMGATGSFHTARGFVFGLMDVAQQVKGDATLAYSFPGGVTGTVSNAIVPFVSGAGDYSFTADFNGVAPITEIAGVAVDLP